jgi:hypothetical protein
MAEGELEEADDGEEVGNGEGIFDTIFAMFFHDIEEAIYVAGRELAGLGLGG